jgi:lipopolysaccharide export LptBFGC system permease protein LptF
MTDKSVMEGVSSITKRMKDSTIAKILLGVVVTLSVLGVVAGLFTMGSADKVIPFLTMTVPMVFILMFVLKLLNEYRSSDDDEDD